MRRFQGCAAAATLALAALLVANGSAAAAPVTSTDPLFCATLTADDISEFTLDGRTTSVDYPATGAAGSTVEVTIGISPVITNDSAQPVEVTAGSYGLDVQDEWGRSVATAYGEDQPVTPTTVAVGQDFPSIEPATFSLALPGTETDRTYYLVPSVAYANDPEEFDDLSFGLCLPSDTDAFEAPITSAFPVAVTGVAGSAPTITLSPAGPVSDGQRVTVRGTGFEPETPIVVVQCVKDRRVFDPDDCGYDPEDGPIVDLSDEDGGFTARFAVIVGPLGNEVPPAQSCTPTTACVITAFGLTTPGQAAQADLTFGPGTTPTPDPEPEPDESDPPAGEDQPGEEGGAIAGTGGTLPATGGSLGGLVVALVLLQAGAILVVRANRARSVRIGSHRA